MSDDRDAVEARWRKRAKAIKDAVAGLMALSEEQAAALGLSREWQDVRSRRGEQPRPAPPAPANAA